MALLVMALTSFVLGALPVWDGAVLRDNLAAPPAPLPFWAMFAVFFPAVTGFTQGVSMSGDLHDPARSIPRGTFAAVGLSMVVYFAVAQLFGGAPPPTPTWLRTALPCAGCRNGHWPSMPA